MPDPPDPIVFIHGAFCSSACWEDWRAWLTERAIDSLAPSWPHNDGDVATLRERPDPELSQVGIHEILDHHTGIISRLARAPRLVGHSFGGLFVQMLLARGLGRAGVVLHPAPPRGVNPTVQAIKANLPILSVWSAHKKVHTMSFADYCATFDNGSDPAAQRATYDRFIVPTPGRPFVQAGTSPFHSTTAIDWMARKAPLLIMAGGADLQVSASMNEANFARYAKNPAVTEFKLFPDRNHMTLGAEGWQEVAEATLAFFAAQAR